MFKGMGHVKPMVFAHVFPTHFPQDRPIPTWAPWSPHRRHAAPVRHGTTAAAGLHAAAAPGGRRAAAADPPRGCGCERTWRSLRRSLG